MQICVDGQEVLSPELPIAHGYGRPYNYIELPDEDGLFELRDVPHGTLTREFYKSKISDNWGLIIYLPPYYLYRLQGFRFCICSTDLESEISWSTTGKVNLLMDNLIAAGKIKPFAIVMGNGMVKQRIDELKLNTVRFMNLNAGREILPTQKKYQFGMQGKTWHGRIVHGFCTDNKNCMRSPRSV